MFVKIPVRHRFYEALHWLAIAGMAVMAYGLVLQWGKLFHPPLEKPKPQHEPQESLSLQNHWVRFDITKVGGDVIQTTLFNKEGEVKRSLMSLRDEYVAQSGLAGKDGSDQKGKRSIFSVSKTKTLQDGTKIAVLTYRDPKGFIYTKTYTLKPNSYLLRIQNTLKNLSEQPLSFEFFLQLKHQDASGTHSSLRSGSYFGFALSNSNDSFKKIDFSDIQKNKVPSESSIQDYLAFVQLYYISSWITDKLGSELLPYARFQKKKGMPGVGYFGAKTKEFTLKKGEKRTLDTQLFSGPKTSEAMAKAHENLGKSVSYGWLWPISKIFLATMKFYYGFVGNWGLAIMLLTLTIKVILFPLNHISYRSMAKMRQIGPKMKRLKEQFAGDREALSKQTMLLYKSEKVNPMGGCLPMIFQIPIFLALYWMIKESVELESEPFFFWIHDLSSIDNYFVLPILMGASMVLQQKLSPMTTDPAQAKMFRLMPYAFTLFFLWFPAGLTLYWVTNNSLTVLQQYIIKRQIEKKGVQ